VTEHELKIWPQFYKLVVSGVKPFEIRKNDRDYQVGDVVLLREWEKEGGYTSKQSYWQITYILLECPGLKPGYCVLGLYGPWYK